MTELPSIETIRAFLRFEDGRYFWQPRPREYFASDRDWKIWNTRFANKETLNSPHNAGYYSVSICKKRLLAHRVIWAFHYGRWPIQEIDHINGNRRDNRIENLREVSRVENNRNRKGVKGVWKHEGRYRAGIGINGKSIHLGVFDTLQEALAARKVAERKFDFHPNHGRI